MLGFAQTILLELYGEGTEEGGGGAGGRSPLAFRGNENLAQALDSNFADISMILVERVNCSLSSPAQSLLSQAVSIEFARSSRQEPFKVGI